MSRGEGDGGVKRGGGWDGLLGREEEEGSGGLSTTHIPDHMRVSKGDAERGGGVDARVHAGYYMYVLLIGNSVLVYLIIPIMGWFRGARVDDLHDMRAAEMRRKGGMDGWMESTY